MLVLQTKHFPFKYPIKTNHRLLTPRAYKNNKQHSTDNRLEKTVYYTEITKNVLSITTSIIIFSTIILSGNKLMKIGHDIEIKQSVVMENQKQIVEHQNEQDMIIDIMFNEIKHFKEIGVV
jgi:hypothetical protein